MSTTQTLALIVEDDTSTREFLVRALAKSGVATVEARTAGRALVMLEQDTLPSVVILDLVLPDANGAILLRRIRRDRLPIRVAIVTGVPDPWVFLDPKYPPDRVFGKPVQVAELVEWVRQALP